MGQAGRVQANDFANGIAEGKRERTAIRRARACRGESTLAPQQEDAVQQINTATKIDGPIKVLVQCKRAAASHRK